MISCIKKSHRIRMKCPLTTTLSFINHRNDLTLCVTELKCFRTFIPRLNSYCCNDYFCLSKIEENIAYAMVSFQDFHSVPKQGEVSICERDGRLCTLPLSELNVSQYNLSTLVRLIQQNRYSFVHYHRYIIIVINISGNKHHPCNIASTFQYLFIIGIKSR